ncbi:MAG: YraN family protein [Clostridiales bacterium]|jgi:putative endonuclease|nr:YraN family protein [Clostridiales bacterium]
MTARLLGAMGEQMAARYLRDNGYHIKAANYRTRIGEIDIIASKGKYICFIEVKTRRRGGYLMPKDAVDECKERKIIGSAEVYMAYKNSKLLPRFDIIEVLLNGNDLYKINHIKGAF